MFEVVILIVIPELTLDEYAFLFSCVSSEKQKRIMRFCDFQSAQNCLLGDILARTELCHATGLSNKQLEFATNPYGKPYLTNSSIYYNISHASSYVACVVADEPVGIDIEFVKYVDVKIAERFFSPNEVAYILSVFGDMRIQRFFEVWTKKESRIKLEGKGLLKHLSDFNVLDGLNQSGIFYHSVYSDAKVMCHVCSSKKEAPNVRIIDVNTLLHHFQLCDKV